jgi:hypothetical protein
LNGIWDRYSSLAWQAGSLVRMAFCEKGLGQDSAHKYLNCALSSWCASISSEIRLPWG